MTFRLACIQTSSGNDMAAIDDFRRAIKLEADHRIALRYLQQIEAHD